MPVLYSGADRSQEPSFHCPVADLPGCVTMADLQSSSVWWIACGVKPCQNRPLPPPPLGAMGGEHWPVAVVTCFWKPGASTQFPTGPSEAVDQVTGITSQMILPVGGSQHWGSGPEESKVALPLGEQRAKVSHPLGLYFAYIKDVVHITTRAISSDVEHMLTDIRWL